MEMKKYKAAEFLIIELLKNSDWQVNTNSIIVAHLFNYRVSISWVMESKNYMAAEFFKEFWLASQHEFYNPGPPLLLELAPVRLWKGKSIWQPNS